MLGEEALVQRTQRSPRSGWSSRRPSQPLRSPSLDRRRRECCQEFTRTAAHPASIAAKTYLGWKWMSAMTGIWDFFAITERASASSWLGTATRTMSQPVAVSSAICWRVALMSAVSVVVIDCTLIGASPPTAILPTWIWRLLRRGARVGGGRVGGPRSMLMQAFHARQVGDTPVTARRRSSLTGGPDRCEMIPLAAAGVTDVPEEHEAVCTEMEAVQGPDRSERQAEHVPHRSGCRRWPTQCFPGCTRQGPWSAGLEKHRQGADDEDRGRHRSRQQRRLALTFPPLPAGFLFSNHYIESKLTKSSSVLNHSQALRVSPMAEGTRSHSSPLRAEQARQTQSGSLTRRPSFSPSVATPVPPSMLSRLPQVSGRRSSTRSVARRA